MELAKSTQTSQTASCKSSSGEAVFLAVLPEFHASIMPTVLPVNVHRPVQSAKSLANIRKFPDRLTNGRAQPVLCTFLI